MDAADPFALERQLDQEVRLVADAVAMVSRGGSRRVTVAGLQFGEAVLERTGALAKTAGVRIVRCASEVASNVDIVVEAAPVDFRPDDPGDPDRLSPATVPERDRVWLPGMDRR